MNPKTRSAVPLAVIALIILAGLVAWVVWRGRVGGAFTRTDRPGSHATVAQGGTASGSGPGTDGATLADTPMSPVMDRWLDTERKARTTPRVGMGAVVGTLKSIRQDAAGLGLPECAQPMQTHLVSAMDKSIEAHNLFISGNVADRPRFQQLRRESDADLKTGEGELVDLQKGQGACKKP